MNKQRAISLLVAVCLIAAGCIYDATANLVWGGDATISRAVAELSKSFPMVTVLTSVAFGVLLGHFFVPQKE